MTIRKAVFPVAGLGSRFLPATKSTPKEMLPIVDKPLIHYAVEEAVNAGVEELIFVTSCNKRAIEDYFDANYELRHRLAEAGKTDLLSTVENILPAGVTCSYVRQAEPLGLGHAVLCAAPLVGDEPFAVLLADDLIDGGDVPCMQQMVSLCEQQQLSNLIAVQKVPMEQVSRYGVVAVEDDLRMTSIVEKPTPAEAPSNLAVVGRYILDGAIFKHLRAVRPGAGGEIQLTDAIASLLQEQLAKAYIFQGVRYDCGSKIGYLQATLEYALKHPQLGAPFLSYCQQRFTQKDEVSP